MEKNYTWQHWNDPQLLNTATLHLHNDHLTATGTQTCDRYSASWSLTTIPRWVTQHVSVEVAGEGWMRALENSNVPLRGAGPITYPRPDASQSIGQAQASHSARFSQRRWATASTYAR